MSNHKTAFVILGIAVLAFARVVGDVPAGAFQLEGRIRDELFNFILTSGTFAQRLLGDSLRDLEGAAFLALILVDRHGKSST